MVLFYTASNGITGSANAAKRVSAATLGARGEALPPISNYQRLPTKSRVSGNLSKVLTVQQKHPCTQSRRVFLIKNNRHL